MDINKGKGAEVLPYNVVLNKQQQFQMNGKVQLFQVFISFTSSYVRDWTDYELKLGMAAIDLV